MYFIIETENIDMVDFDSFVDGTKFIKSWFTIEDKEAEEIIHNR